MLEDIVKNHICFLSGEVVHSKGIGKLVGMPTADIIIDDLEKLPPMGVYSSTVTLEIGRAHV